MLCAEGDLYVDSEGSITPDRSREAGLAHTSDGRLTESVEVYGEWPENAWAVATRARRTDGPPLAITVYYWSGHRWEVSIPAQKTWDEPAAIVPWGLSGAVMMGDVSHGRQRPFVGLGSRFGRTLSHVGLVSTFDSDSLVLIGQTDDWTQAPVVRLWPHRLSMPALVTGLSWTGEQGAHVAVRGLASVKPANVVVYGSLYPPTGGLGSAYLARFDGRSLVRITPPPTENVTGYVESPAGVAWAISSESETPWRREAGGEWRAEPLPMRYQPDELSIANDDVWIRAYGPIVGTGASRELRGNMGLFTTARVDRVIGETIPQSDSPSEYP
jgi:hypothetical protein